MKINLFISYSHQDETYRNELEKHLSVLRDNEEIEDWSDRKILPGQEWDKSIKDELNHAKIILFLVSPDFIASDYCKEIEVKRAMEKHANKESIVIPILIRYCNWEKSILGKLQALPIKDGNLKPVKAWGDIDEAFYNVVKEIEKIISTLGNEIKEKTKIKIKPWEEYKKKLITEGRYFYFSPWLDSATQEEHEFKKILRGKAEKSVNYFNQKKFEAIIDLWQPLIENRLFQINIEHWKERPYFRRYIQAGKSDLFTAYTMLALKKFEKENFKLAFQYLDELLLANPYALKGPAHSTLETREAKFENDEAIIIMTTAKSLLEELINKSIIIKGTEILSGIEEFTLHDYLERINHKMSLIHFINKK